MRWSQRRWRERACNLGLLVGDCTDTCSNAANNNRKTKNASVLQETARGTERHGVRAIESEFMKEAAPAMLHLDMNARISSGPRSLLTKPEWGVTVVSQFSENDPATSLFLSPSSKFSFRQCSNQEGVVLKANCVSWRTSSSVTRTSMVRPSPARSSEIGRQHHTWYRTRAPVGTFRPRAVWNSSQAWDSGRALSSAPGKSATWRLTEFRSRFR